jgi:hypothetical protein
MPFTGHGIAGIHANNGETNLFHNLKNSQWHNNESLYDLGVTRDQQVVYAAEQ